MPKTWTEDEVGAWFAARIPAGWFASAPSVRIDRDEILVIGVLSAPDSTGSGATGPDSTGPDSTAGRADQADLDTGHTVACTTHITGFRETTREDRMAIADEAEVLWDRKVSWGVECDGHHLLFTTQSVPVMTRLRMDERAVVDTLIAAGVARSRSEALAWCVRLVGEHQGDWIGQLRDAMAAVDRVRSEGPRP